MEKQARILNTRKFLPYAIGGVFLSEVARTAFQSNLLPQPHDPFSHFWIYNTGDFHNGFLLTLLLSEGILKHNPFTKKQPGTFTRIALSSLLISAALGVVEDPASNTWLGTHSPIHFLPTLLGHADPIDAFAGMAGVAGIVGILGAHGITLLAHKRSATRQPHAKSHRYEEPPVHEGY